MSNRLASLGSGRAAVLRLLAASLMMILSGCGYVGDPLPPALNIPLPVRELSAVERGDQLHIAFTIAPTTTEGLPVRIREVQVLVGPGEPQQGDRDVWEQAAVRVPVTVSEPDRVDLATPVRPFTGQIVTVGVRVVHKRGRASQWVFLKPLAVVTPLSAPAELKPEPAPQGVTVLWTGRGRQYRVYRRAPDQKEAALLATVNEAKYTDTTAAFGTPYLYSVQAVTPAGDVTAESERSAELTITPVDRFGPSAPAHVTAAVGVNTIELTWERPPEPDLAFYRVYRQVGDATRELAVDKVTNTAYSDSRIEAGKRYRYVVTAVDRTGNEGPASPAAEATP